MPSSPGTDPVDTDARTGPDTQEVPYAGAQPGVFGTLALGLKVLGSELALLASTGVRALELRQMRRRLSEEYALLGRLTARRAEAQEAGHGAAGEEAAPSQEEVDLALGQIDFLKQEIARMEAEREQHRETFLADRRARLSPDPESPSSTEAS